MLKILWDLTVSFSKIGLTSLGGGNSMLKLLEYEAVQYRHWVEPEAFIGMVGTTFLFPGLTGVKLAALIGFEAAGWMGLIIAVLCLNLPGLLLAFLGYQWLSSNQDGNIKKIMISVQYGALALLGAALFSISQDVLSMYYSPGLVIACIVFFIALAFFQLSPFWGFIAFIGICFFLVR